MSMPMNYSSLWIGPLLAVMLAVGFGSFLVSSSSARAEKQTVVYATKTLSIYSSPDQGEKPFGRIFVASQLTVMQRQGDWIRVTLNGWYQEGAKRVLNALPGKRIQLAVLGSLGADKLTDLSRIKDPDTEILWNGASFEGWVRSDGVTADLESIWRAAWDLFATRCTACHQRRIPHKYTANQWVSLLKVMGPRTGLPKEQQRLILTYLQHHASDTMGEGGPAKP